MTETGRTYAMGGIHEYPDIRDYSPRHEKIAPLLDQIDLRTPDQEAVPTKVDLRQWCPPVEDQLDLGSCTANAGAGMIEYSNKEAFGKACWDASRLFLYKTTRNLLRKTGDTGADLRTTMGAMVLFGVPPRAIGHTGPSREWARRALTASRPPSAMLSARRQIDPILQIGPAGHKQGASPDRDKEPSRCRIAFHVRFHGVQFHPEGGRHRDDTVPGTERNGGGRACHHGRGLR